jgi:hypothetical protein
VRIVKPLGKSPRSRFHGLRTWPRAQAAQQINRFDVTRRHDRSVCRDRGNQHHNPRRSLGLGLAGGGGGKRTCHYRGKRAGHWRRLHGGRLRGRGRDRHRIRYRLGNRKGFLAHA